MTTPRADQPTDSHASDGVLIAVFDGERGPELDASRAHLEQCDECRARLATIAADASRVRASLAFMMTPSVTEDAFRSRIVARSRRSVPVWRRPAWQAAAAVIVIAGVAAASPVREWIRRRFEHQRSEARPAPPPSAPDTMHAMNRSGATVSFPAAGSEFTVRLDSVPGAGALTATRTSAASISARVASGAGTGGDEMVVLPGELRIRNASASRATYEISLPGAVTRLRVVVAGRTVFDGAPPIVVRLDRPVRPDQ